MQPKDVEKFIVLIIITAVAAGIFALVRLDTTGERGSGLGQEYIYDISELVKIDPNLILYEESAKPINTGFTISRGVAVDSQGTIYAAGDKAIRIFNHAGSMLSEINLTDSPRCLTVSAPDQVGGDRIYIAMPEHVEVYNKKEQTSTISVESRIAHWDSLGGKAILTSIAVWKEDVFVADAGNRVVLHYDTTGKLINRIPDLIGDQKNKDKNIEGFIIPSAYFDLAVAPDGLLQVVNPGNHRIESYTFSGDLELCWGKFSTDLEGFIGCCNPVNIAILPDGSFITCEKGITRVKIYDRDGNFVGVVAGPQQLLGSKAPQVCQTPAECQTGGFDVAVDNKGQIYVLDTIKNIVRVFARKKAG